MGEGAHKPIRVALADDNADVRLALKSLLGALGHSVAAEAADGAELVRACMKDPIDLAIADLDMPVMDGLEAAEELTRLGVPVILLSGHPDVVNVKPEHEPIAVRLLKPATREKLTAAIATALLPPRPNSVG